MPVVSAKLSSVRVGLRGHGRLLQFPAELLQWFAAAQSGSARAEGSAAVLKQSCPLSLLSPCQEVIKVGLIVSVLGKARACEQFMNDPPWFWSIFVLSAQERPCFAGEIGIVVDEGYEDEPDFWQTGPYKSCNLLSIA
eukprot:s1356_g21.t1